MSKASGTFELSATHDIYDESPGAKLSRTKYTKTFQGDLVASSTVESLQAVSDDEKSAAYVGMERISGTLGGRSGSFVLQHSGLMVGDGMELEVKVLPGMSTDELTGLSGTMSIDIRDGQHFYEFEYSLEG